MPNGTLITIEGIDGAGKSTLAASLEQALAARGLPVQLLREPGGVALAERIRKLVKDPALAVSARSEALLYAAARAQLAAERIAPALEQGAILLLDRFLDSSLAYQGAARGLGLDAVRNLNAFALGGIEADRTLLLRIQPALARARRERSAPEPDRIEAEREPFFEAVAAAYEHLASLEPARFRVIDASGSPAEVLAAALLALDGLPLGAGSGP